MAVPLRAACLVLLSLAAALPARAQHTACALPEDIRPFSIEQLRQRAEPPMRRHAVDGYLLALSWSPAYCQEARPGGDTRFQCERNSFGFVVHGLWPQSSTARTVAEQPAYCRDAAPISATTHRAHLCLVPGVKLMTHEWQKHGVCAFRTADDYFAKTAALRTALRLPNFDVVAGRSLTAGIVRDAFVKANPALPRTALMVDVDRKSRLREVRLCYNAAFDYTACDRPGAPDSVPVRIIRISARRN